MRLAHKLFLITTMTLVVLAISTTTASASESIEVHTEDGTHCDPCEGHVIGESRIYLTSNPAVVISRCEDEFDVEMYEDGSGHVTTYTNTNHSGGNCLTQQCNGVGEAPTELEWEFSTEEISANAGELATIFCLDSKVNPNSVGGHCLADVIVTEPAIHTYNFAMNATCPTGTTLVGEWNVEGATGEGEHL